MMNRRTALTRTVLGAAAISFAPPALARLGALGAGGVPMYHQWKPVRGKHVLVAKGVSGNMVLVLGKDGAGALLVDTQTAPFGAQIRREAEDLGRRVELVVNTHHHPEITGGNHAFTGGTRVLAHPGCQARIAGQMNRYISQIKEFLFQEENKAAADAVKAIRADWRALHDRFASLKPREFSPTEVLDAGEKTIEAGGRKVVLKSFVWNGGNKTGGHTDNDLVVHLPDDDVLIVGGLVSAGVHAAVDHDSGANTVGWRKAIEELERLAGPKTVVVPGEGPVVREKGNRSILEAQGEYLETLRRAVEAGVKAGKTRAEVRKLRPKLGIPRVKSETRLEASLDSIYEEVKAQGDPKEAPGGAEDSRK